MYKCCQWQLVISPSGIVFLHISIVFLLVSVVFLYTKIVFLHVGVVFLHLAIVFLYVKVEPLEENALWALSNTFALQNADAVWIQDQEEQKRVPTPPRARTGGPIEVKILLETARGIYLICT